MPEIDRRAVLATIVAAGAARVTVAGAAPASISLVDLKKEAEVACLYHCDFGDPARFAQMLNNISNHYSVYGGNSFDIQLAMVVHSAGVKFFLESLDGTPWKAETLPADLFTRTAGLAANGLNVYLCAITFERLKLDRGNVRKAEFIRFVPSGVATVAALQSKGFAYLKVG